MFNGVFYVDLFFKIDTGVCVCVCLHNFLIEAGILTAECLLKDV